MSGVSDLLFGIVLSRFEYKVNEDSMEMAKFRLLKSSYEEGNKVKFKRECNC